MAANVNIYIADDVIAGTLANRWRRAANLMHFPCLSEEQAGEILPKINVFSQWKIPISTQSIKFNILFSMVVTALLPWLQKRGLQPSFKPKLISALV